jgi:hypothetical protein
MLNVIELEKNNRIVSVKQVKPNYILEENNFLVEEYDPDYLGKVYDPITKTVSEYIFSPEEQAEKAISWRDSELFRTDSLMLLPDYPYKDQLTAYRQALRDWPATTDFPDTRPTLGI